MNNHDYNKTPDIFRKSLYQLRFFIFVSLFLLLFCFVLFFLRGESLLCQCGSLAQLEHNDYPLGEVKQLGKHFCLKDETIVGFSN